jgi:phosphate transport system substrate-binding protein
MSTTPIGIVRKGGITRTVFVISLIIVGAGGGLGGYFLNAILHPGTPTIELSGAGSSLVYPILSTWTSNYHGIHSNIQINYQSIGSGAGVTDFQQKVVDFAGTDAAPDSPTLAGMNITLTIPETIGAVALAYNVPSLSTGLRLNETIIARIFNGTGPNGITTWNDPAIAALNPGVSLPSQGITTVHRADSSGTTYIFEGYLLKAGPSIWNTAQSKSWPTKGVVAGQAQNFNTGVANYIISTTNCYCIGYVEVAYALQNNMNVAYVQNKDRSAFIKPALSNITAAVAAADITSLPTGLQSWSAVSLILEPGVNSYPILGFTYILVYQQLNVLPLMNLDKAKALVDFIWYVVHDGQSASATLDYPMLPQSIVNIDETSIKSVTYLGQSLPT